MNQQSIFDEFIEHGTIENSLKVLEYGARLKEVCDRHQCSLNEALIEIRRATARRVEVFYIRGL
jgi:hypothetical protein